MTSFLEKHVRLGLLAYAVPPSEFAFAGNFTESPTFAELKDGSVPDYTLMAIGPFMVTMAIEACWGAMKGKKIYRINDWVASMMLGLLMLVVSVIFKQFSLNSYLYIYNNYRLVDLPVDGWVQWVTLFLGVDLAYYWMHRYAHTYHIMWTSHSVHHSGEDYNLATALRQGAFQSAYSWVYAMPLALFCHPACYLAHSALNTLGQFWIHTKLVGDLGPLEYVLNTPSHHRCHHRVPGNCNYAGVLIIWDRMFGTFEAESAQIEAYGLARQYESFDPTIANFIHAKRQVSEGGWGHLLRRRAHHKWKFDPLAVFQPLPKDTAFARWTPTDNVTDAKRVKTDFPQHFLMSTYCILHFLLVLAGTVGLMHGSKYLSKYETIFASFALLWSYGSIGRLFDMPSVSTYSLESLRLLLLLYVAPVPILTSFLRVSDIQLALGRVVVIIYWVLCMAFNSREACNPAHKASSKKSADRGPQEGTETEASSTPRKSRRSPSAGRSPRSRSKSRRRS